MISKVMGVILLCQSSMPLDQCVLPKHKGDVEAGKADAVGAMLNAFPMEESECLPTLISLTTMLVQSSMEHYGTGEPPGLYYRLVCGNKYY